MAGNETNSNPQHTDELHGRRIPLTSQVFDSIQSLPTTGTRPNRAGRTGISILLSLLPLLLELSRRAKTPLNQIRLPSRLLLLLSLIVQPPYDSITQYHQDESAQEAK